MSLDDALDANGDSSAVARTLLTFRLGPQVYAADVTHIREIVDLCEISPLPDAPHDVLGMIDLRSEGIAIVDLARRLGVGDPPGDDARIIVFDLGSNSDRDSASHPVGILAHQVLGVEEVSEDGFEPVPSTPSGWSSEVTPQMIRTDQGIALNLEIGQLLGGQVQDQAFDFG